MHKSVLLNECLENLKLKDDSIVVDATLGYGGHSSHILQVIKDGYLYCFDQDIDAINFSNQRLKQIGNNFEIINSNFENIKERLNEREVNKVDGILFDLGVSSPQLDQEERGFSFHNNARLDMRMDKSTKISAYEIVNEYSQNELVNIFYKYGEEKYASSIAKNIVKNRKDRKIETTLELVEIIKESVPEKYKREKHPARKVFQAIRIEVNNELEVFENALNQALELINIGGRICVITFHSLEDRICKTIFKNVSEVDKALQKLPIIPEEYLPKYKVIGSFTPTKEELNENKRSRSAKLRVIERIR
ncbi:MAG TPA: 16S rRNA (cytosine(1402)-N(4))-methyltransferase RsmH [Tenericutes bacterium]|nr:16S rRNA (cytosine(1402)-N(4))-methyltransferase RsmH [Mycoplasmatota bacterium]